MSASTKSILLLGATGYIGGTVLQKILDESPDAPVTILIRDQKKSDGFKKISSKINVVVGSMEDASLLTELAAKHDVIVNCANADDLGATKALLEGAKKRKAETTHRVLYIHTSGTGVLGDEAKGMYATDKIYTDLRPSENTLSIDSLPDSALHREVDLAVLKADEESHIKAYIVLPSTIYGLSVGPLFDAGLANPNSIQVPALIRAAADRKRAGVVGDGRNLWPNVHISDLGNLYQLIYKHALVGDIGHGHQGYYFGESGEHSLFGLGQAIGNALVGAKIAETAQPTTFTQDELDKYMGGSTYLGCNSRARADRSRQIGWRPKYGESGLFDSIPKEVESVIAKYGTTWKSSGNEKL